ncbi:hypothetical protein SAV31267_002880 [Streptomyces avermitilis]|uniref:Uncharacterized protein n=1 Tax=Streptomyces avermitilis TaxID=33903 RepID=A0A4D4MFQ3_STRAX|nr:hypothetical protein SAV31267_002880 [Streptomyces avermitilis]
MWYGAPQGETGAPLPVHPGGAAESTTHRILKCEAPSGSESGPGDAERVGEFRDRLTVPKD